VQSKTTTSFLLLGFVGSLMVMTAAGVALTRLRTGSPTGRPDTLASAAPDVIRLRVPVFSRNPLFAQEAEEEEEVPPEEIEKYIAVYKAMQRDHSLTVERAAAQQGLTLAQFRQIENKVERDDLIRERVREALRNKPSSPVWHASPQASPKGRNGN
jgi:hypothetical protein